MEDTVNMAEGDMIQGYQVNNFQSVCETTGVFQMDIECVVNSSFMLLWKIDVAEKRKKEKNYLWPIILKTGWREVDLLGFQIYNTWTVQR